MNSAARASAKTLRERIAAMIRLTGPMSVSEYMHICLNDPDQGYYSNRRAIGRDGDFVTAPGISQIFGELVGIWCVAMWKAMGSPAPFLLAEAGPGHGTLMADLIRAAQRFPEFLKASRIRLIETSPAMIAVQQKRLLSPDRNISWVSTLEELEHLPLLLVANEFLDVLPIRQYMKSDSGWLEHCVGLTGEGELQWVLGTGSLGTARLPEGAAATPDGTVFEVAPAREAWVQLLSERIASNGGAALLIDYGHSSPRFGSTFQAVRAHRRVDPLSAQGMADLTAHVDFSALGSVARDAGAIASQAIPQGTFLNAMGISERASAILAKATEEQQVQIKGAVERLVLPEQMGELFRVFSIASANLAAAASAIPPFIE